MALHPIFQETWSAQQAGPAPYEYLVIDIETGNAPEADVRAHFEETYQPPSNYKDPEKLAAHRKEAFEKAKAKSALLPMAPITAIGLKSGITGPPSVDGKSSLGDRNGAELRCLHCMRAHPLATRMGGAVEGFLDARGMLEAFFSLLGARVNEETVIVGFNIRDFDLPAIRRATARQGMHFPMCLLNPDQPLFDNMHKYLHLFAGERGIMIAAKRVSAELGIEPHRVSGAVVPELHAAGEYEAVIDKVLLDVIEEEAQFLRMTGRS
jgi:hypothetical protein